MLHASIDVGTNTVRLLIAEHDAGALRPLLVKRFITRLGGGFTAESGISTEAAERTLAALADFSAEIRRAGVTSMRAVATSAVREAVNGASFCGEVLRRTGLSLDVISGEEEGDLTLKGVLSVLGRRDGSILIFDIGGGSTEYVLAEEGRRRFVASLPLGVVRITESDPRVEAMEATVSSGLRSLIREMEGAGVKVPVGSTLVGTAGTATTIAAIDLGLVDYDYRKVNNHSVTCDRVEEIYRLLLSLTPAERLQIPGLEKGREDLVIAGSLIILSTMRLFGFDRLTVSDFGLLEGVLVDLAAKG